MRFTKEDIRTPDAKFDLTGWAFSADLRNQFDANSNHDITEHLKKIGVITKEDETDSESACTWVYFRTEKAAYAFLRRLNAVSQIKSWKKPVKRTFIMLKKTEFDALRRYIKTLPAKHQEAIKKINVGIYGKEQHYTNA